MDDEQLVPRLRRLPRIEVHGVEVALANRFAARLLGLAWISRGQAGSGLLIPRCAGVHTFGMRFPLDLVFLDRRSAPLAVYRGVGPRRFVGCRGAAAVLEIPSPKGGEFPPFGT